MFFSQLTHAKVLQPAAEHPMEKWIIGSELVGLFFVEIGFVGLARCASCASELVIGQDKVRIALHGVGPNRNSFRLAAQLPERFAFFLARENQVISFGKRSIQTGSGFIVTGETV